MSSIVDAFNNDTGVGQIASGKNPLGSVFGGLQSNYQAQVAPLQNPVTPGQLQQSYDQTNGALTGQQQLAALLGQQNGLQNQQAVFGQQQDLAGLLAQQAAGTGPNPALAQLNQQTGNNISQQSALMASQRGAGANAGLLARQAGMQGGNIQQQAVGQQATLQAQQQVAAQQQLGQQQAAMQQMAGNQVANQMAGQNAYTSGALQNQGSLLGSQGQFNSALTGAYNNANDVNSGTANKNAGVYGQLLGGGMQGAGSAAAIALNQGGVVPSHMEPVADIYHPNYAHGGKVQAMVSPGEMYIPPDKVPQVAKGKESIKEAGEKIPGKAKKSGDHLENDTVSKDLEPGGIVIPKSVMESKDPLKEATKFLVAELKKHGGEKEKTDFHEALKRAAGQRGKK